MADGGPGETCNPDGLLVARHIYRYSPASRAAVVLVGLLILYFRLPTYFSNPQFWGEESLAWLHAHSYDWQDVVVSPLAGYQVLQSRIVAFFCELFPTSFAPAIHVYTAALVTLGTVYLATSPRFEIPFSPLCALAVVTNYQGNYVLGSVNNLQWVLPITACIIILMRPHGSRSVFIAEAVFLAVMSLSGPVSVFMVPAVLLVAAQRRNARITAFLFIVGIGALIQIISLIVNFDAALAGSPVTHESLSVILNNPYRKLFSPFGKFVFSGWGGVAAASGISALLVWTGLRKPYRTEKVFILLFSAILFAGEVYKTGIDLDESYALRYFFIPGTLAVWFAAYATASFSFSYFIAAAVAAYEIIVTILSFGNTGLAKDDFNWSVWAKAIDTGLPVTVAVNPPGWLINVLPSDGKPYSQINSWIGQPIDSVAKIDHACTGAVTDISKLHEPDFANVPRSNGYHGSQIRWRIKGTAPSLIKVTVVTDGENKIRGFGFGGFPETRGLPSWIGTVPGTPGDRFNIYGLEELPNVLCTIGVVTIPAVDRR
jgi:hypothetical protein